MNNVHYFQRFSQKENVHTNNTLLLLSRIQVTDPRLLRSVLGELFGELPFATEGLNVGVQFSQQTSAPSGTVPDGMLLQTSFRVVVETKLHQNFGMKQLKGHLSGFGKETTKILLFLSPERLENVDVPGAIKRGVVVVSRTFSDIIAACRAAKAHENLALRELVEDYEEYCFEFELIANDSDRMVAVPVTETCDDNLKLNLYYTLASRVFRKHRYIGLYRRGEIIAVGKLENNVCANLLKGTLFIKQASSAVTKDQKKRISEAIALGPKHGYKLRSGIRFLLVEKFEPTHYRKLSSGGIMNKQYFNIRQELAVPNGTDLPEVREIAERLKGQTWE